MTSHTALEDCSKEPQTGPEASDITVTIPYEEYMSLCRDRAAINVLKGTGILEDDNSLGLFTHDPEVALFLAARYGFMTESEAIRAICFRFGMDRQPTAARIKRFWFRFRQVLVVE